MTKRLTGPDTLLYEATMTDPKVFTKPWKISVTLQRDKEAGSRIIEDECIEDVNGGEAPCFTARQEVDSLTRGRRSVDNRAG